MRYLVTILVTVIMIVASAAFALETLWIPAAASNPGLHGTVWTTDLWLYSQVVDADLEVTATFFTEQEGTAEPKQATITLAPATPVEIIDAVAVLFGEGRPGAIRLEAPYPLFAKSRTWNSGETTGTYGQGIPAYTRDDTGPGYTMLGAANHPGVDGVRTNIGIANTSQTNQTVTIGARDPETLEIFGRADVEIGPFGWFQDDLFELLGVGDQLIDLADVVVYPTAFHLVYLSRVDNRSGDGTFVFGSSGENVHVNNPDPTYVDIRAIITYEDGATIDWIKYAGNERIEWVRNPPSGFTTNVVQRQLPVEYCVLAIGQGGVDLTMVMMEIEIRHDGGDWDGGSTGFGTDSRGPIHHEFCKTVNR